MKIRLQKYIASCGLASRRKAEKLIAAGLVKVNGKTVTDTVCIIDADTDFVSVEGAELSYAGRRVYYALYKPRGYVCTMKDAHAEKIVTELVPAKPRVFPVGRLDKDSEGLIILTNDGDLALKLTHPRYGHEKEYIVTVQKSRRHPGLSFQDAVKRMAEGITDDGEKLSARIVKLINEKKQTADIKIVLSEGKKRQIRRMCQAVLLIVKKLVRVRIGTLSLGSLKSGEYRIITPDEIFRE